MRNKAINALLEMGMPVGNKGFLFIVEAMCLFENEEYRNGKIMVLYHKIGKMHNTTTTRVERAAIRYAFKNILEKGNLKAVNKYLSFDQTTNGNLLHMLYFRLTQEE